MFNYLIRRFVQMTIVLFFSAVASYTLMSLAPGGPLSFLAQAQIQINQEEIARIRAFFELDLNLPVRFSRWLVGFPRGPIEIGGQSFFGDLIVGCRMPIEQTVRDINTGKMWTEVIGCVPGQDVTLNDLIGRRTSNGVAFGDFGTSWVLLRDRPVRLLIESRLPYTLQLMVTSLTLAILIGVPIGAYSAVRQYSKFDYVVTVLAFFGSSMPTFFFALLMILVFSLIFKDLGWFWLPSGNADSARDFFIPLVGNVVAGSLLD